jgi:acyl carrier protein
MIKSFPKQQAKRLKEEKYNMLIEVINLINDNFAPTTRVTGDTAIKTDLGLDSFEIIRLICILEDKYQININEWDVVSLTTVNDICNYIASK